MKYLNGELIRVEPGREGAPISHIVWDSYAQREVRIYPRCPTPGDCRAYGCFAETQALDILETIELALTRGYEPGAILDENSPIRDRIRAYLHEPTRVALAETQRSSSEATGQMKKEST